MTPFVLQEIDREDAQQQNPELVHDDEGDRVLFAIFFFSFLEFAVERNEDEGVDQVQQEEQAVGAHLVFQYIHLGGSPSEAQDCLHALVLEDLRVFDLG